MLQTIDDIGEFGLIQRITSHLIYRPELVKVPAGDDAAVYTIPPGNDELISTDTMVEGIHFTRETMSAEDVGCHFCASNFSDIAAMGGEAVGFVLSMALPGSLPVDWVEQFYSGMRKYCRRYHVNLLGGDITGSVKGIVLTGTVIGMVPSDQSVKRSGASPGDLVFVTNTVGDSAAGLAAILSGQAKKFPFLAERHRRPLPQIELGTFLRKCGATSMNDISDGLSRELTEIGRASSVDLVIEKEKIPISAEAQKLGQILHKDPVGWALNGGEDYELTGTIPQNAVCEAEKNSHIKIIGRVKNHGQGRLWMRQKSKTEEVPVLGYDHFKNRR